MPFLSALFRTFSNGQPGHIPLTGANGKLHESFIPAVAPLPEAEGNPRTGGAITPGFYWDLVAAPSGAFFILQVSPQDYGKEIGIRVSGSSGTVTISLSDPSFSFLRNDGTTGTSIVLSASSLAAIEYRVLPSRIRPMRSYLLGAAPVDPEDPGGEDPGGEDPGPGGDYGMTLGSQGWFHTQRDAAVYGDDDLTWSGDHAMITQPAINWATAYGSPATPGALSATNIWRQETLDLWSALNGPIRFMDWGSVNFNPMVNWADRVLPTQNNYEQYGAPDSQSDPATDLHVRGLAFEWMLDLCNRTGRDFWVCVPHLANDAFVTSLAQLIKARLAPGLKVYVEYSNETWNGSFGSGTLNITGSTYTGGNHRSQADHIIMEGVDGGYPGSNAWYKSYAYHCARSFQCWYLFAQVFAGETTRLVNTVCANGNIDLLREGLQNTYNSATYNPHSMQVHLICTAPYIEGQNSADWQANVDASLATDGNGGEVKGIAETYECQWGCYEGGMQAAESGADTWAQNPAIYNAYLYLYNSYAAAGASVFCHYTLIARRSATNAWGLLHDTYEPLAQAHRWRATLDWIAGQTT